MRIITNMAICTQCGFTAGVFLSNGVPVCKRCRSTYLLGADLKPFEPRFADDPKRVFRASRYTPEVKCRRMLNRPYSKYRERRKSVSVGEVGR